MVAAQRQPPALAFRQPSQRVIARRCVNCAYGDRAGAAAVRLIDAVDEQETRPAATKEEHTSELQSLMRNSYAVFCLKKKKKHIQPHFTHTSHKRTNATSQAILH